MSPQAPAPAKKVGARVRKPVVIEQIGVDDWAGGKGHIKAFILGGPDTGKTRWASSFPRPIYLGCEPTVAASIASRKIAYEGGVGAPHIIRVNEADRPSDAMLDALDYLKKVNDTRPPGGLPKYQTAVLDTLDGLQRLLKDEWVESESAGMFTGRDAWGFIEAKINLILTRLMNLDMNVVILCHLKDKELEEQVGNTTQKRTVYEPFLQGSIKDSVFHDFDLVGLMKREIVGGDTEVRGITFDATNTFPFLKDHYNLTAPGDQRLGRKFWPITLDDGTKGGSLEEFEANNYTALWTAIVGELDTLEEGSTVEEVPAADGPAAENVTAPAAGGPVPPAKAPAKAAAKVPAKAVAAAPGNGAAPTPPQASEAPSAPQDAPAAPAVVVESSPAPATPETPSAAPAEPSKVEPSPPASASGATTATPPPSDAGESVDPGGADGDGAAAGDAEPQAVATSVAGTESAPADSPASVEESATSVPTHEEAVATAVEGLGGEVVAEGATADVAVGGDAARDHGGCPICGKDMSKEQPDLVQLSRLKHRTLVLPDGRKFYDTGGCCYEDYQSLNEQKASGTGLYAA